MVSATLALLDPNELPRYTVPEAAHYLRMPHETLKSWVVGRNYPVSGGEKHWAGLIKRPDDADPKLSFSNLIEAHVLLALRKQYGVKMKEIRESLEIAQERFNIPRVLLSPQLRATKGNVFLDQLHQLTNLSKGGQGAIPEILEAYLERIDWNVAGMPDRMHPLTRPDLLESPKLLAIDPRIAFGRPVVKRNAIKTSAIAERFRAGESISELADDYDLEVFEVEEALRYELPDAA
ncbi:MAG TPA: DUF433 domain-containing protein [Thermoanaerobaculia bacterium]|nr:DUF433 domain-containing protein [Thermoanaerobaculia bacterium]